MKRSLCIGMYVIGAILVFSMTDIFAQSDLNLPWLDRSSVIARCEVRQITHGLLLSDVRRVESGAPVPVIPYRVTLDLLQAHPRRPVNRLQLESIVITTWMPSENDRGIISLQGQGREYYPSGIFPTEGYLPEKHVNGEKVIEFPPDSGNMASADWVWECLCDLLDSRLDSRDAESAATQEKWTKRLLESGLSGSIVALQYLLRGPETMPALDAVMDKLPAMIQEVSEKQDLVDPFNNCILKPLARQASEEQAKAAYDTLMDYVSTPEFKAKTWTAEVLAELACRKPSGERVQALRTLLGFEFSDGTTKRRLISSISSLTPAFRNNKGDDLLAFQETMLRTPQEFAILLSAEELALYWELLAEIHHPVLREYLIGFLKSPTPAYLEISAAPPAIESLKQKAEKLIAVLSQEAAS